MPNNFQSEPATTDYLIWSCEHNAWWRPNGNGYTGHLSLAGRYSREEALAICAKAIPGADDILPELPVREADLDETVQVYFATKAATFRKPEQWR